MSANYVYHVINSVKGGCGKSTFTLWLAEYWRSKNEPVYIIDLDTDGTSWKEEYNGCFGVDCNCLYINDIVENSQKLNYLNPWRIIDSGKLFTNPSTNNTKIHACIADPSKRTKNTPTGYEIDLFEQAIECLIKDIIKKETVTSSKVHVIFDMAPGTDEKSEMFLNRYLFTNKFLMYKGKYRTDYSIRLYMLSTLMESSWKANFEYVDDLMGKLQISNFGSVLPMLKQEKRFEIRMIFNDVQDLMLIRSEPNHISKCIPVTKAIYQKTFSSLSRAVYKIYKDDKPIYYITLPHTDKIPYLSERLSESIPVLGLPPVLTTPQDLILAESIYQTESGKTCPSDTMLWGNIENVLKIEL